MFSFLQKISAVMPISGGIKSSAISSFSTDIAAGLTNLSGANITLSGFDWAHFDWIASLSWLALIGFFIQQRGLLLLLFFQQEEYDGKRFALWLRKARAYDVTASLWVLTGFLLLWFKIYRGLAVDDLFIRLCFGVGLVHGWIRSKKAQSGAKKPLIQTERAKRILQTYVFLALLAFLAFGFSLTFFAGQFKIINRHNIGLFSVPLLLTLQLLPLFLILANRFLSPLEQRIKAKFRQEAVEILAKHKPIIIAITGSFGKTSTKHILGHILEAGAPTLITPGSVNTEMGITRIIREQLRADHRYFIVEMGAYAIGSIARLCRLTPPKIGLITAVGAAHYERFKSLEAVADAKFELAEAVFKEKGTVILAEPAIDAALLKTQKDKRKPEAPGHYQSLTALKDGAVADLNAGDYAITDHKITAEGQYFTLSYRPLNITAAPSNLNEGEKKSDQSETFESEALFIPLFGRHQLDNTALAVITARSIGLPWSVIRASLKNLPQIKHRLAVTKSDNGPTIIDDAYNANPIGFAAALDCLQILTQKDKNGLQGRRILITPGMVELGEKHDEAHRELGHLAAQKCDIVAVVGPKRIPSFITALEAAKKEALMVQYFDDQNSAEAWIRALWRAGDAVLFENNLPDIYEKRILL